MKWKACLLLVFCAITNIHGCNRGSSSTTSTTPAPVEEIFESETASTVSRSGSGGAGGARRPGGGRGSGGNSVTASQLRILSENLLNLDTGGAMIPINAQGRASSSNTQDMAAEPLIGNVPASVLNWETTRLMQQLLDNYEPLASVREVTNSQEQSEEDNFLNALMATAVMQEVEKFLKDKKLLSGSLRSKLKEIWFTQYKRAGRNIGSSGFEHVFVGELKGGKVSGFHNWLNFRKEEQDGDLDYKGYMKRVSLNGKGEIIKLRFVWLNEEKPVGSIFVGTTPELEIALYTVCFIVMPDANCPVQLAGHKFAIQTWTYDSRGKPVIGSAYPNI
ncbi:endoribonuclease CG2145-like isoform X2 [Macrobrachium rosenbergii]|uniref:endoribonuclease CG2145-like isoform X2 n=1 Tax=Macrobrachium rosenbergii TaxID=79674 RepID=UPI0034D5E583